MHKLQLKYKKLRESEPAFAPVKRDCDADFDLFCSSPIVIAPKAIVPVNTNIAIEFPVGYEGKVEDKSGLALNKGIHVLAGVIDQGYTGEIVVILVNLSDKVVSFEIGNKIAQIKIRKASEPIEFVLAENLHQTERGADGFGSTGT